jgi:hypothetical protein
MTKNPFIDFLTYLGLDWRTLREVLKSTKKGSRKCVPHAPLVWQFHPHGFSSLKGSVVFLRGKIMIFNPLMSWSRWVDKIHQFYHPLACGVRSSYIPSPG